MSICVENIIWKVGKKVIVNNVLLWVLCGEMVGLLGFNGCGKFLLLCVLVGLCCLDVGCVIFDGQDIVWMVKK